MSTLSAGNEAHAEQYESAVQQREAAEIGTWVFLSTEVLFFGAMFLAYVVLRWAHHEEVARFSRELNVRIAFVNTFVLLTSSLTIALGAHLRQRRWFVLTAFLGLVFLVLKAVEYQEDLGKSWPPSLFLWHYYVMTAVHATHLMIGVGLVGWCIRKPWGNKLEMVALYWHFVDVVWVFLFPLLYLVDRGGT